MKRSLFFVLLALLATGCDRQLEDFVRTDRAELPSRAPLEGGGIKRSPGYADAQSNSFRMKVNVTPTQVSLSGVTIGARVGLSRSTSR